MFEVQPPGSSSVYGSSYPGAVFNDRPLWKVHRSPPSHAYPSWKTPTRLVTVAEPHPLIAINVIGIEHQIASLRGN
jgi:hypothetical protein